MPESAAPAIGFSISYQIDEKRSIVAQTHVDQDCSSDFLNEVMDRIRRAQERQARWIQLDDWKKKLAHDTAALKRLEEDFKRISEGHLAAWEASGKKGSFRLGTKEEADKRNAESTISRYMEEIARDYAGIAECEAAVGLTKPVLRDVA